MRTRSEWMRWEWVRALRDRRKVPREPAPQVLDPSSGDDRCGHCLHERRAHEHLRRGTDCALCRCAHFRRFSE